MIEKIHALIATVDLTEHKVGLNTLNEILEEAHRMEADLDDSKKQLEEGRNYLMQVEGDEAITVADSLEAFGFGRNGLGKKQENDWIK